MSASPAPTVPLATTPVYDLSYHAVEIIIPVTIDASGGVVELFGDEAQRVEYQLTLKQTVSAGALYGGELSGLLMYIELSGESGPTLDGTDRDKLDVKFNKADLSFATNFAQGVHNALCAPASTGMIDASAVYTSVLSADQSYESFGDFVVSYIAQQVFGHPRATAAIANDSSIITRINATETINDAKWADAENSTNPTGDIVIRLVQALRNLSDGLVSTNAAAGDVLSGRDGLRNMVKQMMLQDPARFAEERNELVWYALQFRAGDRLVFNIKLKGFTFNVQGTSGSPSQYKDLYTPSVVDTEFSIIFDLE
jgi:hypothetical protein